MKQTRMIFRSDVSKAFVESLDEFGDTCKEVLVSDLKRRGVFLEDERISLAMLHDVLLELLGEQATELIMESVILAMDKFYEDVEPIHFDS